MSISISTAAPTRGPWAVTGCATAVLGVVQGVFGSIGVLIDPLAAELGAPREQLVLLFARALAVHTLTARRAGRALDRYGPRPLLLVSAAASAAGMLAPGCAGSALPAIAGYGIGLGLASACCWVATTAAVGTAVRGRRRTAAMGLLSAGPAVGCALLAPALTVLVQQVGIRPTCVVLAVLGAATCGVGAAVLTGRGGVAGQVMAGPLPGLRPVLVAAVLMSLVAFLPLVHAVAAAAGLGLSAAAGAAVLAVVSSVSAATRIMIGWLVTPDTLPALHRAAHVTVAAGFGLWALTEPGGAALPLLLAAGALFGVGYGGWLALGPALLATTCPPGQLGRSLGALAAATGIGGVIGPVLAGPVLTRDPVALWAGATVIALVAAAALPHRPGRCAGPSISAR